MRNFIVIENKYFEKCSSILVRGLNLCHAPQAKRVYINSLNPGVMIWIYMWIYCLLLTGVSPVYAGLSGSSTVLRTMPMSAASGSRPHSAGQPGALVDDWNKCVKHLTVSSRERQASRLYDRSLAGCWQSSGRQGHVSPHQLYYLCNYAEIISILYCHLIAAE